MTAPETLPLANISLKEAILWPFQGPNRKNLLWIPALLLTVFLVAALVIGGIVGSTNPMDTTGMSFTTIMRAQTTYPPVMMTRSIVKIVNLFLGFLILGYNWEVLAHLRRNKQTLPEWTINPATIFKRILDGLKFWIYWIGINVPVYIPILIIYVVLAVTVLMLGHAVFHIPEATIRAIPKNSPFFMFNVLMFTIFGVFIAPYLLAPFVYCSEKPSLRKLFKVHHYFSHVKKHYGRILVGVLYSLLLIIIYTVAFTLSLVPLAISIVGLLAIPFAGYMFLSAYSASVYHIYNQAFPVFTENAEPTEKQLG